MSLKSTEIKFEPNNLCCALEELFGRCIVCQRDFCKNCFFATHNKMGNMYCGATRLYWKNMNFLQPTDPSKLELWPVDNK